MIDNEIIDAFAELPTARREIVLAACGSVHRALEHWDRKWSLNKPSTVRQIAEEMKPIHDIENGVKDAHAFDNTGATARWVPSSPSAAWMPTSKENQAANLPQSSQHYLDHDEDLAF
jgi:ribosome-binding ATPase YchF (GTP1/OBG family)